jgi:hypothetical protein
MIWLNGPLSLHQQIKTSTMNTDNTLAFISTMISSESSYKALMDMINEMDLEIMGVSAA